MQPRTTPQLRFTLNGAATEVEVDAGVSLLDLLRERTYLSGTKNGCNQGACGVCSVLVDGPARARPRSGRTAAAINPSGTADEVRRRL